MENKKASYQQPEVEEIITRLEMNILSNEPVVCEGTDDDHDW